MEIGKRISLDELVKIIFEKSPVQISSDAMSEVDRSYGFLEEFSKDKIMYGINTGFGPMAQYRVDDEYLTQLQYNIIRSHSTGAGKPLDTIYVRAAMMARLMTFLQGKSGVHRELVDILKSFINNGIYPYIPEHGSVGASGDLVQLAHIALALIGEGEVFYKGELRPTAQVIGKLGIEPLKMHIREGLSATNGTSVMTGIGIVNLVRPQRLFDKAVLASVMMNEIASSYDDFMAEPINEAKLHHGQREVARMMREYVAGSACVLKR